MNEYHRYVRNEYLAGIARQLLWGTVYLAAHIHLCHMNGGWVNTYGNPLWMFAVVVFLIISTEFKSDGNFAFLFPEMAVCNLWFYRTLAAVITILMVAAISKEVINSVHS